MLAVSNGPSVLATRSSRAPLAAADACVADVAPNIGDVLDVTACVQASSLLYPGALSPVVALGEAGVLGVPEEPGVTEGPDGLDGVTVGGTVTGAALA